MNAREATHVHFIGIGGINMSAVAKLLLAKGVAVSGSDLKANDQTEVLAPRGATIAIGEAAANIPADADLVVYTSAAPETNLERAEAARRNIPQLTNFQFLGEWYAGDKVVIVTGTHGKSTTTAMLGTALIAAGLDPTVIVGSKVPGFPDGNLRQGSSDLVIIEGDEYARHFLEFRPYGVIINNIELDHTDVFSSLDDMVSCFGDLLDRVQKGGVIVANAEDANVVGLIGRKAEALAAKGVRVTWTDDAVRQAYAAHLQVPGAFNRMNATCAGLMASELGAPADIAAKALEDFTGIWRRFEFLKERNGARWYADYGHHPTAVKATIAAVKESFPGRRLVLCFQPHHRNRTKHLFFEFTSCFEGAEAVVLCEIYDVAGRDAGADADISSRDLYEAAIRHDRERDGKQHMEYAETPVMAIQRTAELAQPGDIVVVMGAGDIDAAVRRFLA